MDYGLGHQRVTQSFETMLLLLGWNEYPKAFEWPLYVLLCECSDYNREGHVINLSNEQDQHCVAINLGFLVHIRDK